MGISNSNLKEEKKMFSGQSGQRLDQIFITVFYSCIGFFSTFSGVFGRHTFQVPFIVLGLFIGLRFAMRPHCRDAMVEQFKSKQCLAILLFAFVLLLYAIVGIAIDQERLRLIGKPFAVLLSVIVFAYIWAYRENFDKQRIISGLFYGIFGGLAGVVAVSAWNWLQLKNLIPLDGLQQLLIPISIYSLNDELKILSVLIFFAVAGLTDRKRFFLAGVLLSLVVWCVSFYTFGANKGNDGILAVTRTNSDVVQFGLPIVILLFLVSGLIPRLMTNLVFLGIAMLLILSPWIFQIWYRMAELVAIQRASKFLVRAEIWDKVAQTSLQKPLFGHGLDATRYMGTIDFAQKYYKGVEVTHPHNMFVQTWMDMGLVGVLFGLLLCYLAWKKVRSIDESVQPAILAGISMYVLYALATHSLWQTWNMVLFSLMCVYASLPAFRHQRLTQSNNTI